MDKYIDKMAEGYPYIIQVEDHYEVGLDPTTHFVASEKDLEFIANYYNVKEGKVPNRTGDDEMDEFICPRCGHTIGFLEYDEKANYCYMCGQKLSWKNIFQNGKIVKRRVD